MRWLRFYTPQALSEQASVSLDEASRHHMVQVLRIRQGERVTLFNGDGYDYHGKVALLDRKQVVVVLETAERVERESSLDLSVYVCVLKNETMDRVIQKAVELGVKRIVPVRCERMEWRGDEHKKHQHWQGIIQASAMQCGRAVLPELSPIRAFAEVVSAEHALRLIFTPHHESQQSALPKQAESVGVWIGCEGGFSPQEVQAALAAGWQVGHLGKRILRADTAAIVAMAQVQSWYGDM
ncbi:MAG: 16S rRNA (uracil(1498)-N(3))-methyltransferase [Cardiobacteriaceae bacterium]|nr:16S rRNA (uracil(1498)-N(3))-methyltransferase [Cardiobacteriaceae bacterium]